MGAYVSTKVRAMEMTMKRMETTLDKMSTPGQIPIQIQTEVCFFRERIIIHLAVIKILDVDDILQGEVASVTDTFLERICAVWCLMFCPVPRGNLIPNSNGTLCLNPVDLIHLHSQYQSEYIPIVHNS